MAINNNIDLNEFFADTNPGVPKFVEYTDLQNLFGFDHDISVISELQDRSQQHFNSSCDIDLYLIDGFLVEFSAEEYFITVIEGDFDRLALKQHLEFNHDWTCTHFQSFDDYLDDYKLVHLEK